jgi:hypothetical protein
MVAKGRGGREPASRRLNAYLHHAFRFCVGPDGCLVSLCVKKRDEVAGNDLGGYPFYDRCFLVILSIRE